MRHGIDLPVLLGCPDLYASLIGDGAVVSSKRLRQRLLSPHRVVVPSTLLIVCVVGMLVNWLSDAFGLAFGVFGDLSVLDKTIAALVIVVVMYSGIYMGYVYGAKDYGASGSFLERLTKFDDSIFLLIPGMVKSEDSEVGIKSVVDALINALLDLLDGRANRGIVLYYSDREQLLIPIAHFGMPDSTINRSFFRTVESADTLTDALRAYPLGVAGRAFVSRQLQVAHRQRRADGTWICDHADYVDLDSNRGSISYKALTCFPITRDRRDLGVVCLDSYDAHAFDDVETHEVLTAMIRRFALPMLVHETLHPDTEIESIAHRPVAGDTAPLMPAAHPVD